MYSDMSMRTIACSESNINSASARASSVLPTPVGPMKRKVPIGRFGSCSPALEVGDLAVLELGGPLEVGVARGALDLAVGAVELLLDVAHGADRVLLALP